jgi:hypothetical protein
MDQAFSLERGSSRRVPPTLGGRRPQSTELRSVDTARGLRAAPCGPDSKKARLRRPFPVIALAVAVENRDRFGSCFVLQSGRLPGQSKRQRSSQQRYDSERNPRGVECARRELPLAARPCRRGERCNETAKPLSFAAPADAIGRPRRACGSMLNHLMAHWKRFELSFPPSDRKSHVPALVIQNTSPD